MNHPAQSGFLHTVEFFRGVNQYISRFSELNELGNHILHSIEERSVGFLDYHNIVVAEIVCFIPGSGTKENDLLRIVILQQVNQGRQVRIGKYIASANHVLFRPIFFWQQPVSLQTDPRL